MATSKGRILQFENRKYEEADFVIPSQDTKGHGERIYFRIQPGHMRELHVIMSSKRFPFRTIGDIGRLAIKLAIDMLHRMEPMPSVSQQTDAIIKLVRDEEFNLEFVAVYESVSKAINRYVGAGEEGQARRMLLMVKDEIDKMPKGYWRKKYRKELKQKFGYLLKDAGVDLKDGQEDDEDDEE